MEEVVRHRLQVVLDGQEPRASWLIAGCPRRGAPNCLYRQQVFSGQVCTWSCSEYRQHLCTCTLQTRTDGNVFSGLTHYIVRRLITYVTTTTSALFISLLSLLSFGRLFCIVFFFIFIFLARYVRLKTFFFENFQTPKIIVFIILREKKHLKSLDGYFQKFI